MKLINPKPGTAFHVLNGRLALFQSASPSNYWRQYWSDKTSQSIVDTGHRGELPEIDTMIERWAPRGLPVLEAGCGPGHVVAALKSRGYTAIGIEYEQDVVDAARRAHPDLDLRVGDVRKLEFLDGAIGCYLSLGVVEHFIEGPLEILREARRVLDPRGVALISVPYLNPLRKHHRDSGTSAAEAGREFHQYYFEDRELSELARDAGFTIVDRRTYAVEAFLCREHPIFARVWKSSWMRTRMRNQLRRLFLALPPTARDRYSHMILFACRPV